MGFLFVMFMWSGVVYDRYDTIRRLHVPYGTSWFMVPYLSLVAENPRVPISEGVELFTSREFSRGCCDYGPTVFKYGPLGEVGLYDYKIALEHALQGNETSVSVYACIFQLGEFVTQFFLKLPPSMSVVLVTGQEDCGPTEIFGMGRDFCDVKVNSTLTLQQFLGDRRLKFWFAQNYDMERCETLSNFAPDCKDPDVPREHRAKVKPLPIGLDYHTIAEKQYEPNDWSDTVKSPARQESELKKTIKVPWDKRELLALCVFGMSRSKKDRYELVRQIESSTECTLRPTDWIPRQAVWDMHNQAAFVFSPQGRGIDTHRLYEALNLESVPVVRSSSLDKLYKQFPIIILGKWQEFNCGELAVWKQEIVQRFGQNPFSNPIVKKKLRLSYWVEIVKFHKQFL